MNTRNLADIRRVGVCAVAAVAALALSACESETREQREQRDLQTHCGLRVGNVAQTKLDQRRGMIVEYSFNQSVWLRFAVPDIKTTHSRNSQDLYTLMKMECFELEPLATELEISAPPTQ